MSESNQGVPRYFQPMLQNQAVFAHYAWGYSWGPHGQRPDAAAVAGFDQSQTPLVLREAAAANAAPGPIEITPGAGATSPHGVAASSATITGTLTLVIHAAPVPRIARPPATRLISVLGSVLVKSFFDRVIAPYIAQEQHEHYEALLRRDFTQANIIGARMYPMIVWIILRSIVAPIILLITRGE